MQSLRFLTLLFPAWHMFSARAGEASFRRASH